MRLARPLTWALALLAAYLPVWGLAYVVVMASRGDQPSWRECYDYLVLAWTFEAGELPSFIWAVSLVGYALIGGVLIRRWRKPTSR